MSTKRIKLDPETMENYKKDLIKYNEFKKLERSQQAELFIHYSKSFSQKEIAEIWGVKSQAVHTLKYTLKKEGYIQDEPKKKPTAKKKPTTKKQQSKTEAIQYEPDHIPILPMETMNPIDIITNDQRYISDPYTQNEPRVSLDEFMKMIEIQQRIAEKMDEAEKSRAVNGIQFNFKGDYNAADLTKRLNKIITMIDGESNHYKINIEIMEIEPDPEPLTDPGAGTDIKNEICELQQEIKELQTKVEAQQKLEKYIESSYKTASENKQGLHAPESEFKTAPKTGIIKKNDKTLYQTFYICPDCGHKAKHYIELGTIYVNCHSCGKRMRTKEAIEKEYLKQDLFGNFFIAGKFKRQSEIEKNKSLFEVFK